MEAVGLIVEYNPFHNGHQHHIDEAKKRYPKATIIVILNGNFLQRGEPAIVDKFTRAKWALAGGADIVLELPFAFGTQRADIFAHGNISIANKFQVSKIIYGIEEAITTDDVSTLLPNQRLAFFYEKKIQELAPDMEGISIPRMHASYLEEVPNHASITSATAIRKMLCDQKDVLKNYVPPFVYHDLLDEKIPLVFNDAIFPLLQQRLVTLDKTPALMQHGMLENVIKSLETHEDFRAFFQDIHHKHMSKTHTMRALTYLLCNVSQHELDVAITTPWTKILGVSEKGQTYIRTLDSTHEQLGVITKYKHLPKPHDMIQYNSAIVYSLLSNTSIKEGLAKESNNKPIFREEL